MNMQPHPTRKTIRERGQSLVEVSLSLMLLLTLFSGIVDLGRAYIVSVALQDAANEAAVYLSIEPQCRYIYDGGSFECNDPNNAEYRARNAGGGEIDWSRTEITVSRPSAYGTGDPVTVSIRYRFPLITPIISQLLNADSLILGSTATHIIISE